MKRACFVVALLMLAIPARAQEAGQIGLGIGIPGSIGIIWHISDGIAVRPDFSFSHTHSEADTVGGTEADSSGYGFGASMLFYTGKIRDDVRLYVAPRFAYARTNSKTETPGIMLDGVSIVNTGYVTKGHQNGYTYAGAFGVQFTPTRRFSVFGEAGLQYSDVDSTHTTTAPVTIAEGTSSNSQFGTRTSVGVIFYFK